MAGPIAARGMSHKTREVASDGYHRALAARRQAASPSLADPDIAQAVERQTCAMRELSVRAFPEPDEASAAIEAARAQRRRDAEKTRIAALRQARKDRAARQYGATVAAAAPQPAELRTTA
ncbi:hypothetical protein GCM10023084_79670 [Streptomyces lacrimifluminis]|uniref:Uncharacterized protein n=1 Tax=Streptomyces lacrimifluminis TaxID=1500077 RepID=A0A917PB61_9ACTN|nr:hypothetical protein [Streptomyces lacrimifluminis]GGJ69229.1 hypothetical protein GCM10012282_77800 [Streptomyces lacrimifluminis]